MTAAAVVSELRRSAKAFVGASVIAVSGNPESQRLGGSDFRLPTSDSQLAECFDPGDDATHHAAYHATDGVPTAHPQATECATGHTQQDITDRVS